MADDDDFDIDIYGDDRPDYLDEPADQPKVEVKPPAAEVHATKQETYAEPETEPVMERPPDQPAVEDEATSHARYGVDQDRPDAVAGDQAPQAHDEQTAGSIGLAVDGTDDQQMSNDAGYGPNGEDIREVDPGATRALRVNEVPWWNTEDDIRGWANTSGAEDELNEITFNEHKVNGKSKGELFIDLQSPQAATALKRHIDTLPPQQGKRITVLFTQPDYNPFKNVGKEGQGRQQNTFKDRQQSNNGYQSNQGFRGRGGGGYGRGNFQNRGGYGGQQGMGMMGNGGGMNGMGGFGGQMGFNRGGFQHGRGGRGGGGMMGMVPGMGMGGMNGMGMGMMNMGMGMGFGGFPQGQGQFNNFGGGGSPSASNPHGQKRQRPE